MKIQLLEQAVRVQNPVRVEIQDTGNSYIRASFLVGDISVQLNEPKTGSVVHEIGDLPDGNHSAAFVVAATGQPMGKSYNTILKINGQVIAVAQGVTATFTEADFVNFTLQV